MTPIVVVTCDAPGYIEKRKVQEQTWIPLVRAAGWSVEVVTGNSLYVPDDYLNLPKKIKAVCQMGVEHEWDGMLKLDDDSYPNAFTVKQESVDYGGLVVHPNDGGHHKYLIPDYPRGSMPFPYASGGGYWLSRRAIRIIAGAEINDWAEDRWVGQVLGKAGIPLVSLSGYESWTTNGFKMESDVKVIGQLQNADAIRRMHDVCMKRYRGPAPLLQNVTADVVKVEGTRVLVALISSNGPKYVMRKRHCLNTWASKLPPGFDLKVCTGTTLNVPDDYLSLCKKTQAAVRYGVARGYQWMLKIDDDSEVRTEKLRIPEGIDYGGWVTIEGHREWSHSHCQGGCYWLSRRAMQIIAEASDAGYTSEDRWVGDVLREHAIIGKDIYGYGMANRNLASDWKPGSENPVDWVVMLQADAGPQIDVPIQYLHTNVPAMIQNPHEPDRSPATLVTSVKNMPRFGICPRCNMRGLKNRGGALLCGFCGAAFTQA